MLAKGGDVAQTNTNGGSIFRGQVTNAVNVEAKDGRSHCIDSASEPYNYSARHAVLDTSDRDIQSRFWLIGWDRHQFARVDAVRFMTGPNTIGASPNVATLFNDAATADAMPAFCIPTSRAMVRQVALFIRKPRHTR